VRMVTVHTRIDYTPAMTAWAERRIDELRQLQIAGYVLKKHSPSCGKEGVTLFSAESQPLATGAGLFAEALSRQFPGLPIEEEDALHDRAACDEFLRRVRAYRERIRSAAP
jgi:uncharacterized protein YbbK (DUF523 family)